MCLSGSRSAAHQFLYSKLILQRIPMVGYLNKVKYVLWISTEGVVHVPLGNREWLLAHQPSKLALGTWEGGGSQRMGGCYSHWIPAVESWQEISSVDGIPRSSFLRG